jgi:hypothetical protein
MLRVRWTISPLTAPKPWIACSGCGSLKPFKSSGKIRLNANGKRLDAWLVYKCSDCEKTWNRTLFERRNIRDLSPSTLEALQGNDPEWVRLQEFDIDGLRRKAQRIDESPDATVRKDMVWETAGWTVLEIELAASFTANLRLDRLLASELVVSRTRLQAMYDKGRLKVHSDRGDALRHRFKGGMRIAIDLSDDGGRDAIGEAASKPTAR